MGHKLSSFLDQVALEVFSLHLNALVLSLILLHEFQIKFNCWLRKIIVSQRVLIPKMTEKLTD